MFLWDVIVLGIPAVLGAVLAVLFALVQFRMLFFAQSAGYSARKTLRLLFDRAGQMVALPTVVTLATIFAAAFSFAAPNNTVSTVAMLIWIYAVPVAAIVLFVFYLRSLRKTTEKPVICSYTVGIFLITLALVLLIYWWFGWEWFVQMSMAAIVAPFLVPAAMLIAWPARHLKQKIRSR